jgi:hypothetical protein
MRGKIEMAIFGRKKEEKAEQVNRSELRGSIQAETQFVDNVLVMASKAADDQGAKFNLEMAETHLKRKQELIAKLSAANSQEVEERLKDTKGIPGAWNKCVAVNLSDENAELEKELGDSERLLRQVRADLAALAKNEAEAAKQKTEAQPAPAVTQAAAGPLSHPS